MLLFFWTTKKAKKTIYLTFDDGPSKYTSDLLDILNKYNVELPESLKHLATDKKGGSRFFTPDAIDVFINAIASINLEQARQQILTDLPKFRFDIMEKLNAKKTVKSK